MIEMSLSDVDFYERKIKTLEEDNIYLHDQIMKLRTRLRTAQDFQIKYSLLISNNQKEYDRMRKTLEREEEIRRQQFLAIKLKENDDKWRTQFHQFEQNLRKELQTKIEILTKELGEKNQALENIKQKSEEIEFFTFKMNKIEKENQNLKEQIEEMKRFYEKQRSEEMAKLRNTLSNNHRQKIQNQKRKYESKITDLQIRLGKLEMNDDNVTFKVSDATNKELVSIKALFDEKSKEYGKQLQELKSLLGRKNQEIKKALKQQADNADKYRVQIAEKNQYIKSLEDKILEREKQHQSELLNLVERMNAIKKQEEEELHLQIQKLNQEISRSHDLWNSKVVNHQNEIDELNRKFQDQRRRLVEDKNMHKRKFSELSLKMKEAEGEREMGETQMLINSLRDMDIKEDHLGSYQNGITFLERQIKKVQLKLQEKSQTVSKLYKQINEVRIEADREVTELKEKMKKDKKQNLERISALENQLRDTSDKLRNKQRNERRLDRQLQKQKEQLEEKVKSLNQLNVELTRDYNRVIEDKKGVQASYREERQKSFASKTDLGIIKKQKWLQLEKQKNELHVIFKEKEEQLKLAYEQKLDEKQLELNKLKQDYQISLKEVELLKKQCSRLSIEVENNKENLKLSDYNKKIASLNLQIAVTQNLYENLVKAKSRINQEGSRDSEVKVELEDDNRQPLLISFHPSANIIK